MTEQESQRIQSIDSPVFVAFDGKLEGVLGIFDNIRQGIKSTINHLIQTGFDIIMLTGDTISIAGVVILYISMYVYYSIALEVVGVVMLAIAYTSAYSYKVAKMIKLV